MSDYPKTYRHPVTEQERTATNKAQEVSLKFDGYRVVEAEEAKTEAPADEGDKPIDKAESETPPPAPKTAAPKPGPTPKAQEGK